MYKRNFCLFISFIILAGCASDEVSLDTEISIPVSVEEIKNKPIEQYIDATGTVYSTEEVTLKSEISGYYKLLTNPKTRLPYALGDLVEQGQEIIHLEDAEFENNIKLESQVLNLDISKREFDKQKSLYDKGGVTLRELKNAEMDYINAKYSYENAGIQLAKMKIKAPFSGVIVELPYYTNGTRIDVNLLMVKIMDYSRLYMNVNLSDKYLNDVKLGQSVRLINYTLPDDTLMGKITQVSPAIDPDTRTFKTSLTIDNLDWMMRPGMFVKAEVIIARKDSVIVIPKDILLAKQRGKTVFIVERGAARERVITTGLENPTEVEVTNGLRLNERLIIKGFETLRNRSKVKIIQ